MIQRLSVASLLLLGCLIAAPAFAALPPVYYNPSQPACTAAQPCGVGDKKITVYVPIATAGCERSVQGCIATSRPGLNGLLKPTTVDAVRLKEAKYATCASDSSNYGKYFNIGTVTYRSGLDQKIYTVPNVICYVHDTGSAFRGRPDKLDLATTVCPTCTDAQAMRLAVGSTVNLLGQGPLDTNRNASIFTAAMQNFSGSPFASAVPIGWGTGTASGYPSGQGIMGQSPYQQSSANSNPFSRLISSLSQPQTGAQQGTQPISPIRPTQPIQPILPPTPPQPQASIIVQPKQVTRGNPIVVSWTSVGMSTSAPCRVTQNGTSLATGNSGSKIIQTTALPPGTLTFVLTCSASGKEVKQSASASVQ